MDSNRFIELLENYLRNRADEDEQQELFLMIASGKYDEVISARIDASFGEEVVEMDAEKAAEIRDYVLGTGRDGRNGYATDATKVIPMYKRKAFRWVAAAAVIIIIAAIAYLSTVGVPANDKGARPVAQTDVPAPTNTRAVITLANGSKVYLDSAGNGTIAQENNVNVVKGDSGQISYSLFANGEQRQANSPSYNTLFNPRGSKVISLTLTDGTRVWLNSESSLKYPTAFNSNTREVEITGEAYFEVKHNSKQPFKVHLPNGSIVEDLGTEFNINAYSDEADIKTTLVSGQVRVRSEVGGKKSEKTLKPGEQLAQSPGHQITRSPDLDEVLAWKNGRFQFGEKADLPSIMKQVARWYDVDVEYKDNIMLHFGGSVSRNVTLSELLKALETTGSVHFKIEGKKIIVSK